MADAAAARREARRRKILENSQNRLHLISGATSDECLKGSQSNISPLTSYGDQNIEEPASTSSGDLFRLPPVNNGGLFESESLELLSNSRNSDAAGDIQIANDLAAFLTSPTAPAPAPNSTETKASVWEKLISYKYDVVLVTLLIQVMNFLFTFETPYFFLPIITYTATKLVWFPAESKSNFAHTFLLLNGISASRVQMIMNVSQWLGAISQDICVYLFITICIQSMFMTLNNLIT